MRVALRVVATGKFASLDGPTDTVDAKSTFEVVFVDGGEPPPQPPGVPTVLLAAAMTAIAMLYAKYGLIAGGQGVTDLPYWAHVAVTSGDLDYVLDRLEKDILGTGQDVDTPGFGIRRA